MCVAHLLAALHLVAWSRTYHEVVHSGLWLPSCPKCTERLPRFRSLWSLLAVVLPGKVVLRTDHVEAQNIWVVVLLIVADRVDVLHVRLPSFLGGSHHSCSGTGHESSPCEGWLLVCHRTPLLLRDLGDFLGVLLLNHHLLLLLLGHLLLSQEHHLVLLLLVELGILGVDVEIVLDQVAILVPDHHVFQLVLGIDDLLFLVVLFAVLLFVICTCWSLIVLTIVLSLFTLELRLVLICLVVIEFMLVVFLNDHLPVLLHLVIVLNFAVLVLIQVVVLLSIVLVLIIFVLLHLLKVLNQLLVVFQELLNHFLRQREVVWVLLVLALKVLYQDGFLFVVELVDVDELVVIVVILVFT